MPDVDEIWQGDHLGRRADAEWLATFLRNRSRELADRNEARSYVLNLDAQWGAGKTFFLTRLREQLEGAGHLAVYVNAWRDDFADDPLVAVMAAIDETVEAHRHELAPDAQAMWETVKGKTGQIARIAGKGLLRRGLGLIITTGAAEAAEAVLADVESGTVGAEAKAKSGGKAMADAMLEGINAVIDGQVEEEVSDFRAQRVSIQAFRDNLAGFVAAAERSLDKAAPFFILVDELDRCRPPYAIAMLERIKHLFETPGVVFVVATDSRQLGHAIKAVYGAGFESARYLRRFFDQTYEFEAPSLEAFVAYLMDRSPIDAAKLSSPWENDHAALLTSFLAASDTDLRTTEQVYNHLHSMASAWDEPVPIELAVALPLIMAFGHREATADVAEVVRARAPKGWALSWREMDVNGRRYVRKSATVQSLALGLTQHSEQPLHEAVQAVKANDRPSEWLRQRLGNEMQRRTDGRVDGDNPVTSLTGDYARRVRQAGRIRTAPAASAAGQDPQR